MQNWKAFTKLKNAITNISKLKVRLIDAKQGKPGPYMDFFEAHLSDKQDTLANMISKYESMVATRKNEDGKLLDATRIKSFRQVDSNMCAPIMSALAVLRTIS